VVVLAIPAQRYQYLTVQSILNDAKHLTELNSVKHKPLQANHMQQIVETPDSTVGNLPDTTPDVCSTARRPRAGRPRLARRRAAPAARRRMEVADRRATRDTVGAPALLRIPPVLPKP